jgi:DinB superfamily
VPTVPVDRLLDRSAALTASGASIPQGGLGVEAALATLTERRQAVREMLLAADGLALGEVVIEHPRLGPLNVYQWLVFLGAHEGRHTLQIREAAAALGVS